MQASYTEILQSNCKEVLLICILTFGAVFYRKLLARELANWCNALWHTRMIRMFHRIVDNKFSLFKRSDIFHCDSLDMVSYQIEVATTSALHMGLSA